MVKKEKINLTVVIKTKNSQEFLYEVLEAVKDASEIIALDNHSTDDTIAILKEYKAKIIYCDNNDFSLAQSRLNDEISNDWVLVLAQNEILPLNLLKKIENFILSTPQNYYLAAFPIKTFYLKKEIKCLRQKDVLRLYNKNKGEFKNNYSLMIKPKKAAKKEKIKIFKFKKSSKNEDNILKFVDNNIARNMYEIIEKQRNILKTSEIKKTSLVFCPVAEFIKYYIFKKGFLDGKFGFIFSKMKFIEKFILNIMILEKNFKGEKYDIW